MVLDRIFAKYNFEYVIKTSNYELGKIYWGKETTFFVKPLTFMNLSGIVFPEILNLLNINPEEILIVYDDVALPLGKIRIRTDGSSGGHNGVKSIIENLGTEKFGRLRVGIGPKPDKVTLTDYVLGEFDNEEFEIMQKVLDVSVKTIECVIFKGFEEAMRIYNGLEIA